MAWKLRKDKLKAGMPGEEEATPEAQASVPTQEETEHTPIFDLSGSAFQSDTAVSDQEEPEVPAFLDHDKTEMTPARSMPQPEEDPTREPIALEPLVPRPPFQDIIPPSGILPDPLPEYDPIVAPDPHAELETIAVAPSLHDPEAQDMPLPVDASVTAAPALSPDLDREAIAPALITLESETGLPKVAPFILDTPSAPVVPEVPRTHNVVIRIGKLSATHLLNKDVTTIGRPDTIIQNYPDIEIELDDGVSRRQAEIRHTGTEYQIIDAGSTNGTILNGERLVPHQPMTLQNGDRIRIGEITELQFE